MPNPAGAVGTAYVRSTPVLVGIENETGAENGNVSPLAVTQVYSRNTLAAPDRLRLLGLVENVPASVGAGASVEDVAEGIWMKLGSAMSTGVVSVGPAGIARAGKPLPVRGEMGFDRPSPVEPHG